MTMIRNTKFLGFGMAAVIAVALTGCNNDLNEINKIPAIPEGVQLVKTPDVIAWSGENVLGNTFTKDVKSLPSLYSAYVPVVIEEKVSFEKPEGAVDITAPNHNQDAKVYFIPEGYNGKINHIFNAGDILYNYGNVTLENNVNGSGVLTVYNSGELEWQMSSGERHTVYNAGTGTLNVLNYANIGKVYNFGDLVLDYPHNEYWGGNLPHTATVPSAMYIYSQGGTVTIPCDADFQATADIHNTLYCEGDMHIQTPTTQKYFCGLEVTGYLNIDSDITSSYVKAESINLSGDNIFLKDQGYVGAEKISFEGNGKTIDGDEYEAIKVISNSYALLDVEEVFCKNDKLGNHLGAGVYANFNNIEYKQGGISYTASVDQYEDELLNKALVNAENIGGSPECGPRWGADKTTEPVPPVVDGDETKTTSEVEVNLSILDEHEGYEIADLVTKLSIHVRAATDVKVVIPVSKDYYCDVDDMYIFNEHYNSVSGEYEGAYGGYPDENVISYRLGDDKEYEVKLHIDFNEDNITVWTEGINKEVFEWCRYNYGDGINFEIYNYFNNLIVDEEGKPVLDEDGKLQTNGFDRTWLQRLLNQSTVEFLDDYPDYYINAFNTVDGSVNQGDCEVVIVDGQRSKFGEAFEGLHLNAGDKNRIYKNKEFDGPEGVHDHDFLWNFKTEA